MSGKMWRGILGPADEMLQCSPPDIKKYFRGRNWGILTVLLRLDRFKGVSRSRSSEFIRSNGSTFHALSMSAPRGLRSGRE